MSEKLGKVIRYIRKSKKLTAYELSLRSNFSNSYICDLEKGRKKGNEETFRIIFEALDINYQQYNEDNEKIVMIINEIIVSIIQYQLDNIEKQLQELIMLQNKVIYSLYEDEIALIIKLNKVIKGENFLPGEIANYDKMLSKISFQRLKDLYLLYKGIRFIKVFKYEQAEKYFLDLSNSLLICDSIRGIVLNQLSILSGNNGEFIKSLKFNDLSQVILLEDMNVNRLFINMLNISNVYAKVGDHANAKKVLHEILNQKEKYAEESIYIKAVTNLAFIYFLEYDFNNLIKCIEKYSTVNQCTQDLYFIYIWGLACQRDKRVHEVITECKRIYNNCMDRRLELLIALVYNEYNTLEEDLLAYYNSIQKNEDSLTKFVALRMLVLFYKNTRRYKLALEYSKKLEQYYFDNDNVVL